MEITQTTDDAILIQVIQKLPEVKVQPMDKRAFAEQLAHGLEQQTTVVFAAVDDDGDLRGCAVLESKITYEERFLWLLFLWAHLEEHGMADRLNECLKEFARENGVDKIRAEVKRGFRALGKYDWYEICRIFETEV